VTRKYTILKLSEPKLNLKHFFQKMRPNKLTKKESAAMVVEMDGGDTTESEADAVPRSYAAVTARPGTAPATEVRLPPPGPPTTTTASSSPQSPRPGGSGEGHKKRKAAKEARLTDSDSEEGVQHTDAERRHEMMKVELAHATSRAISLQDSVEEFQLGLAESTSMNEELRRREEETHRLHSLELKAQEDRLKAWQDQEAQRVLAAHRQQLRYGILRRSKVSHFLEFSAKLAAKFMK
jgi:hypothetical protein